MKKSSLGFGKLFNVLQSLIGRMASWPMRNIETFPSKQMFPYLSLVERKVAEFYLNIDRMRWLVLVEMTYFNHFFRTIHGVLAAEERHVYEVHSVSTPRHISLWNFVTSKAQNRILSSWNYEFKTILQCRTRKMLHSESFVLSVFE